MILPLVFALAIAPSRTAVVVGIDDADRAATNMSVIGMSGCARDAAGVEDVLHEFYGYSVARIPSKAATLAGIRAKIGEKTAHLTSGDQFVFYFSGLGSTDAQGAPTLLPVDASPRNSTKDLPVAELGTIAKSLEKEGVQVTIVLDASFGDPAGTARGGDRQHYKNMPRHFMRGDTRPTPGWTFTDPGVYMAPVQALGGAFEQLVSLQTNSWEGVFTSLILSTLKDRLAQGQTPTVDDIFKSVKDDFDVEKMMNRYPGAAPYQSGDAHRPLFGGPVGPPTEKGKEMIAQSAKVRANNRSHLRVAVDVATDLAPEERAKQYTELVPKFEEALASVTPALVVAPRGSGDVNLLLDVWRAADGIHCAVRGDETVKLDNVNGVGAAPDAALTDPVKGYLLSKTLQWLLYNRFRYGAPTERIDWGVKSSLDIFQVDDNSNDEKTLWKFDITELAKTGWLLVFDREEPTHTVNLKLPNRYETDVLVEAGTHKLPRSEFVFKHPAVTRAWAVWIEPDKEIKVDLPSKEDADLDGYTQELNRFLAQLLAAADANKLKWDVRAFQYRVGK